MLRINICKGVRGARWGRGSKLNGDMVQPRPQLVLQVVLELGWLFRVALDGDKEVYKGLCTFLMDLGYLGKAKAERRK